MAARVTAHARAVTIDDEQVPTFGTVTATEPTGPPLFRIGRATYRMHADRSFSASLAYLRAAQSGSVRQAEFALIEHVTSPAALDALIGAHGVDAEAWTVVIRRALDHVLGAVRADPGDEEGKA